MAANQNAPGLNRNFSDWEVQKANHVKFPEQYVICLEKHVLVKKKKNLQVGCRVGASIGVVANILDFDIIVCKFNFQLD